MSQRVLITGGTSGIGRAMALEFCRAGASVAINYNANDALARETLAECHAVTERAWLLKADVGTAGDVQRLVEESLGHLGGIDVAINNAGINRDRPFLEMTEADWDRVVNVHLKGTFLVSQSVARVMLGQEQGGQIINLGASTGIRGRRNGANFCAAKAGIHALTKCLAMELSPKVRVNCVIPGLVRTPETEHRFDLSHRAAEMLAARPTLSRIGEPEDVAQVVRFLASPEASYINGQKILIDGGEFPY